MCVVWTLIMNCDAHTHHVNTMHMFVESKTCVEWTQCMCVKCHTPERDVINRMSWMIVDDRKLNLHVCCVNTMCVCCVNLIHVCCVNMICVCCVKINYKLSSSQHHVNMMHNVCCVKNVCWFNSRVLCECNLCVSRKN